MKLRFLFCGALFFGIYSAWAMEDAGKIEQTLVEEFRPSSHSSSSNDLSPRKDLRTPQTPPSERKASLPRTTNNPDLFSLDPASAPSHVIHIPPLISSHGSIPQVHITRATSEHVTGDMIPTAAPATLKRSHSSPSLSGSSSSEHLGTTSSKSGSIAPEVALRAVGKIINDEGSESTELSKSLPSVKTAKPQRLLAPVHRKLSSSTPAISDAEKRKERKKNILSLFHGSYKNLHDLETASQDMDEADRMLLILEAQGKLYIRIKEQGQALLQHHKDASEKILAEQAKALAKSEEKFAALEKTSEEKFAALEKKSEERDKKSTRRSRVAIGFSVSTSILICLLNYFVLYNRHTQPTQQMICPPVAPPPSNYGHHVCNMTIGARPVTCNMAQGRIDCLLPATQITSDYYIEPTRRQRFDSNQLNYQSKKTIVPKHPYRSKKLKKNH